MDMNSLQQWMDFADKNGLFSQYKNSGNGFQPTVFNVPMMEANWARGMAGSGPSMPGGQQIPNFFAGFSNSPASGVTIGDNPYSARVQALQANPYMQQSNAPALQNYLARLLK